MEKTLAHEFTLFPFIHDIPFGGSLYVHIPLLLPLSSGVVACRAHVAFLRARACARRKRSLASRFHPSTAPARMAPLTPTPLKPTCGLLPNLIEPFIVVYHFLQHQPVGLHRDARFGA